MLYVHYKLRRKNITKYFLIFMETALDEKDLSRIFPSTN